MPVSYTWDDPEQTVVHYHMDKNWTWEELRQAMVEVWPLIEGRDVIVDSYITSERQHLPPNTMPHLRAMSQNRPTNTGVMVLVGANHFVKTMITTFMNIYSHVLNRETPLFFVPTAEEAQALIQRKKMERAGQSGV